VGKAALGLLDENARIETGRIALAGHDLTELSEFEFAGIRGKRIGYIYQNPMTALNPVLTVGEQLIETIVAHTDLRGSAARAYAVELLRQAEVPEPEERLSKYPHQLSGGLCQRVVFAIAICGKPELIIADEPTTALDVTVKKAVLGTLRKLAREHGIAIVLITHDMGVVAQMCDHVYVLRHGRLVEYGTAEVVIERPTAPYTRELMVAIPRIDEKRARFDVPSLGERAPDRQPALDYLTASRGEEKARSDGPLLRVQNISKTYSSRKGVFGAVTAFKAVDDISFEVAHGETLGIVGESGSGKSTIGRMVLGLIPPDAGGHIFYRGKDIATLADRAERLATGRSLQCVFQDPYSSLNPRMSAGDNISYAARIHGLVSGAAAAALASDMMALVGLPREAVDKMPHAFSGGERQRIGIARALALRPDCIVCDEPTSALDVTVQAEILNLLKDLQDWLGLTLIFISHDLAVVRQMCDRVMVMKSGRVVEEGPGEEVLVAPREAYTRELLAAVPRLREAVR
jgi:peptide/nickel transport system ATP-binding protein